MPCSKEEVDRNAESVFHLNDLTAPTVSGLSLRILVNLIESPIFGYPLRHSIFKNSGFSSFRQRAQANAAKYISIAPKKYPLFYPLPDRQTRPNAKELEDMFRDLTDQARVWGTRPRIVDYYHVYKDGIVDPVQVAEAVLECIQKATDLNSVQMINREETIRMACESKVRWDLKQPLSMLDGVPFTVKVNLDVAGFETGCGSGFTDGIAQNDANVVASLKGLGMVVVGKVGMDELGTGVRGFSIYSGQIRNCHGREFVSGGSSGGGAVAVACGLGAISVGSDSGGSIRIPASCCGVWAMKASFGRISTTGRMMAKRNGGEVGEICVGPLAGCASDMAVIYYCMAGLAEQNSIEGEDEFEGRVDRWTGLKWGGGVQGLKVGICKPWVESGSQGGLEAVRRVIGIMKEMGAEEVGIAIPDLEDARISLSVLLMMSFLERLLKIGAYGEGVEEVKVGYDARAKLKISTMFTGEDEKMARVARANAMEYCVRELFSGENAVDVILTPALGVEVPKVPVNLDTGLLDVKADSGMMKFATYANCTGLPACVVPMGRDSNGMPMAVQFMGAPWKENVLVEVCLWAEKAFGIGNDMLPEICFNPIQVAIDKKTKGNVD